MTYLDSLNNRFPNFYKQSAVVFVLITMSWWLTQHFGISINLTHSLPYKVFLVQLNKTPRVGSYILFNAPTKAHLFENTQLLKQVFAGPGDSVTRVGQDFYINGKWVATAKSYSLKGEPLAVGGTGTLREGQYYVGTTHPDSFDSRYERMGWITQDRFIGVAYPLW